MNLSSDTIIVGGGLAGACAAYLLSNHERVLLLEAGAPAAGASGVAAGLANPLMGLRARPVWRFEEALGTGSRLCTLCPSSACLSAAEKAQTPSGAFLRFVMQPE